MTADKSTVTLVDPLRRDLPVSADVEQILLGSLLLSPSLLTDDLASTLFPEDFGLDSHRHIYTTMLAIRELGMEVDAVLLAEELIRQNLLTLAGGLAYISALSDGIPHFTNIDHYASVLREKAGRRALIRLGNRLIAQAMDSDGNAETLSNETMRACAEIASHASGMPGQADMAAPVITGQVEFIHEWLTDTQADEMLYARPGMSLPWNGFNQLLPGLGRAPGWFCVRAGATGGGKTMLTLAEIKHHCEKGRHVLYFSLEMSKESLTRRLAWQEAGIGLHDVQQGAYTQEQRRAYYQAIERYRTWRLAVKDIRGISAKQIFRQALAHQQKTGRTDIIVVDHCGLIRGSDKIYDRTIQTLDWLVPLAHDYEQVVLALFQINREMRRSERLEIEGLEGGGRIEQDADCIEIIQRDQAEDSPDETVWPVAMDKVRDGIPGWFTVRMDRKRSGHIQELTALAGRGHKWYPPKKTSGAYD